MLQGSACGFVALRYAILKFPKSESILWGHELANSLVLFRVKCFLQVIKKFFL